MSESDLLIDKLNETLGRKRGILFCPASDAVVEGHELEESGNRSYGKNIYVATGARFDPPDFARRAGVNIRIDQREAFGQAELRCFEKGKFICVAVFDQAGQRLSRELFCYKGQADEIDEGRLAWFGPREDICTPWSDNDPAQCQVITVDRLRAYARKRGQAAGNGEDDESN